MIWALRINPVFDFCFLQVLLSMTKHTEIIIDYTKLNIARQSMAKNSGDAFK